MTPQDVIQHVASLYGMPVEQLTGRQRSRAVVAARHTAIKAVSELFPGLSYPQIARHFNFLDHTSVMYALERLPYRHRKPGKKGGSRINMAVVNRLIAEYRPACIRRDWLGITPDADQRRALPAGSESRPLTPPGISAS